MPPTSHSDEAIVLKVGPYREADLVVDLFMRERGRLTGIARHGLKSRRRFGTVLAPMNRLRVQWKERGGWAFLEEAVLERPLSHLGEDLQRLTHAFYALDCLRSSVAERDPEPRLFDLLAELLDGLNRRGDPVRLRLAFQYRMLCILGLAPDLGGCKRCGRQDDPSWFVFREGNLACRECRPHGSSTPLSRETLGVLCRMVDCLDTPVSEKAVRELEAFLPRHFEYHLGRAPRSERSLALA